MKRIITFFVAFFVTFINVYANDSFELICDNDKINLGDQVVCRMTIKSSDNYNKVNYKLNVDDGLEIVDVRSNFSDLWKVSDVGAFSNNIVNGIQEFGILLLKAKKSGEHQIRLSNVFILADDNDQRNIDNVNYSIKVISRNNYLKQIKVNDVLIDNYDKNELNYIYKTGESKISIDAIKDDEFAAIEGTGEYDVLKNFKNIIIPIKVKSESGFLKTYIVNVINDSYEENSILKTLDELNIKTDKGIFLDFDFDKNNYFYNIQVDNDVKSIDISSKLSCDCLGYYNYKDGKFTLLPGNNVIVIGIKDSEEKIVYYVLNVVKPIDTLSSNSLIKEINIDGYDLKFSKRVKSYNLDIKRGVSKLDFNIKLDDEASFYKIEGNENLKEGSIVKINVTAEDASTSIYKITIGIKKFNIFSLFKYFVLIGLICFIYNKKDKLVISNKKLSLERLLDKYNALNNGKGITKNFNKLSDELKRSILIEALDNNKLVNKTTLYKTSVKILTKKSSVKKDNNKKKNKIKKK